MTFAELVQRRMFLLMIFTIIIFGYFWEIEHVGVNKTVAWAWDISSWLYFAKVYFLPVFLIGYGLLALLNYRTHKNLSIIHLILVILTFIADDIVLMDIGLIVGLNILSMLVFLSNFTWSFRNRKSKLAAS